MRKSLFIFVLSALLTSCNNEQSTIEDPKIHCDPESEIKIDTSSKSEIVPADLSTETIGGMRLGNSGPVVISIVGKPLQRSVAQIWEADGNFHQDWEYKDLVLDMSGSDSAKPSLNGVHLMEPCSLKTGRNIGIGNNYEETKNVYKQFFNREESNDSILVAGSIYGGIIFNFRKGKVYRIFLGAAAE